VPKIQEFGRKAWGIEYLLAGNTQGSTTDTLAHVRDILALLQAFFSSSNLPSTDDERSIHLGIYWLIISEHALAFEMKRME
jgi:hypothetical protein